ncbi:reverse transcriptase family protein [Bariatricus massiliensis]|uniref:RNA-directed DNA polymerase n=1 Tax=Bariatricus massiliensis TaxID=1745713 RepID=A0ABS8DKN0_9FIRM|nr:reverse transcriptase family protein [Bariatricus massiliensis]MCB7305821.1 reverse transcriptase family protein [Bariatricus massiliensis]MCB7376426.1 reverse transcriptase family protein [Bariatricus massiliensis]MCB7388964.1 reverse transcriptase family protein [Bariatricus massiliensis]MCB7413137.1 reverse transcriptase family protein [Bariatricus massiliensis]MCQ5255031.1 reverse transcriptase family protein [Bariatricus massiliensis]
MTDQNLWKYCTREQSNEMLLSLGLLEGTGVKPEAALACLYAVSNHTGRHYRTAQIQKRGGGVRRLLVPDALLNKIQRNLLHHVLDGLPVSTYATAYRKRMSVVDNAAPHVGQALILKLDIKEFFENITFLMVYQSAFPAVYFPPAVRKLLAELCCYEDYLPQGAPTSPAVSNLVMKPFDEYMGSWCGERGICYTRYCDDLTFSGSFDWREVKHKVAGYLRVLGFELNEKKTRILKPHVRQTVTGIVVNDRLQTARSYRRQVRSEVYYCTKYGVEAHLRHLGNKGESYGDSRDVMHYLQHLLGKVHFILQASPEDEEFRRAKEEIERLMKEQE